MFSASRDFRSLKLPNNKNVGVTRQATPTVFSLFIPLRPWPSDSAADSLIPALDALGAFLFRDGRQNTRSTDQLRVMSRRTAR